jgi:hypothetical protein
MEKYSHEEIVDNLKSMEFARKLNAIKLIKHSIIGNQSKKKFFASIGVIPL